MKRVGVGKGLPSRCEGRAGKGELKGGSLHSRPWDAERDGQVLNTVRTLLCRGFLAAPIAMERNGPARRGVGAVALFPAFHIEVLVKQTPPQGHGFPREVGTDLLRDPINRDT